MTFTKSVVKYLTSYAEPEATLAGSAFYESITKKHTFEHVLVIPAYNESIDFLERFCHDFATEQNVLLVAVINQPDDCIDSALQNTLYQQAKKLGDVVFSTQQFCLVSLVNQQPLSNKHSMILLVNRFDKPIPADKGVGLARKIGVDIAVQLICDDWVKDRWVYSSDADAHLPCDYFKQLKKLDKHNVAACFDFFHYSEDQRIHRANQQYEQALRYYVAGLTFAKSHYNFFTIGSTLAFDFNAYCMARGFPTRAAGEDFYLLNKLAKLGKVAFVDAVQIKIDARTSDRVPFGTGPAVTKILAIEEQQQAYCYYHPHVFIELKQFLSHWQTVYKYRNSIAEWLLLLSPTSQQAVQSIGFVNFIEKHKNDSQKQFTKQLDTWFDAFKTLKFIHHVREHKYADIPLIRALKSAPFKVGLCS